MTPIHAITPTAAVDAVYEPADELTQKEMELIIKAARMVKGKQCKRLIVELAYGKSNELHIEASKPVRVAA